LQPIEVPGFTSEIVVVPETVSASGLRRAVVTKMSEMEPPFFAEPPQPATTNPRAAASTTTAAIRFIVSKE
jgi:hypothetical protein